MACRQRRTKQELLRIVKLPDGTLCVDEQGKMQMRGAYLCRDKACVQRAIKTRAFGRNFHVTPDADWLDRLEKGLDERG